MAWQNPAWFPYDVLAIVTAVPRKSGVYAIRNSAGVLYVGEAHDIQVRLLQHLNGDVPGIAEDQPSHFSFELVPARDRVDRRDMLVRELRPAHNLQPLLREAA